MKKMVCEICGSQSIRKENGVFICQECGTEYSLDEAKSLLKDIKEAVGSAKNERKVIKENTNVSGKEELLTQLYLWAKNLSDLQDMYLWFDEPISSLKQESFWLSDTPFDNYNDEVIFPYIKDIEDNQSDISHRFYNGLLLKDIFNEKIKTTNGYLNQISKMKSYSSEKTNSSDDLYHKTAPKYRICVNGRNIGPLEYWCSDCNNSPFEILDLKKIHYEVYYSEFSKWSGSKKVIKASNVEMFLKQFVDKCQKSADALILEHNQMMDIYRENAVEIRKAFNTIIVNCKSLESSLFLPYEYRDLGVVMELINAVRSGKATTWKELVNLYDTQVYRNNVVNELKTINLNLVEINNTLIKGFTIINQTLNRISSSLESIDNSLNAINIDLKKSLASIERNTFITMWNTL